MIKWKPACFSRCTKIPIRFQCCLIDPVGNNTKSETVFKQCMQICSSRNITLHMLQSYCPNSVIAIPVNSRQPEELVYSDLALIPGYTTIKWWFSDGYVQLRSNSRTFSIGIPIWFTLTSYQCWLNLRKTQAIFLILAVLVIKYVQRVLPKLHTKRAIIRTLTVTHGMLQKNKMFSVLNLPKQRQVCPSLFLQFNMCISVIYGILSVLCNRVISVLSPLASIIPVEGHN